MEQNKPRVIRMAELCEQKGKLAIVGAELSNQHQRIQQLEKAESDLIKERDLRDEIIDRMADAVLGKDRHEWTSNYDYMDAAQEVEDRIAELEAQLSATNPIQQGLDAQTTRDAVIQHLTSAGVLEHDGCGIFIASGDASELIDACMALSTHAHHEKGAAAQAVALLATGGQAQAVERITIDMKQAAGLLDLFGGESTEFTVMQCNGHSGHGLYAYVTEYPEEGASYLGKTDCEAQPALRAQADAQDTDRWMEIGKAIERACADLPEETEIIVSLEKDAGTVTLIDQDGNEHENFSTDYGFAGVLNEAIDAAIAAQAKKGV